MRLDSLIRNNVLEEDMTILNVEKIKDIIIVYPASYSWSRIAEEIIDNTENICIVTGDSNSEVYNRGNGIGNKSRSTSRSFKISKVTICPRSVPSTLSAIYTKEKDIHSRSKYKGCRILLVSENEKTEIKKDILNRSQVIIYQGGDSNKYKVLYKKKVYKLGASHSDKYLNSNRDGDYREEILNYHYKSKTLCSDVNSLRIKSPKLWGIYDTIVSKGGKHVIITSYPDSYGCMAIKKIYKSLGLDVFSASCNEPDNSFYSIKRFTESESGILVTNYCPSSSVPRVSYIHILDEFSDIVLFKWIQHCYDLDIMDSDINVVLHIASLHNNDTPTHDMVKSNELISQIDRRMKKSIFDDALYIDNTMFIYSK